MKNPLKSFCSRLISRKKSSHVVAEKEEEALIRSAFESSHTLIQAEEVPPLFDDIDRALINDIEVTANELEEQTMDLPQPDEDDDGMIEVMKEEAGKKEKPTADVDDKEPQPVSLLDNDPYIKLMEQNSDLIREFESYRSRMSNDEACQMLELITDRLREAMYLSGAIAIEEETQYNLLRHSPVPMSLAKEGTLIEQTLTPGVAIENRVFVKAKVKLAE